MFNRTKQLTTVFIALTIAAGCNNAAVEEDQPFKAGTDAAQQPVSKGAAIFQANCVTCHDLARDKTGPALAGALGRWNNDTARIKAFIHNSTRFIATGDPYAVKLYEHWNKTTMTPFPTLTDAELDELLQYISHQ